jgi:hypothetical protein
MVAGLAAGRMAARHPYVRAARLALAATGRTLLRTFRQLGLEITGFFFLVFAALGGFAAYREYPALQSGEGSVARMAIISVFTMTFLWFGVTSLWRARRGSAAEKPAPRLRK